MLPKRFLTRELRSCRAACSRRTAVLLVAAGLVGAAAGHRAAAQAPPAPEPAARAGEIRIGPGDVLSVDVFGLDELDRKVRVGPGGTISLPLLGEVSISGLSLSEAEAAVERLLEERQLLRDPDVSIFVEELVSQTVYIQGAVSQPGVYQMLGPSSLLDMLGKAGGLSAREGERAGQEIVVVRSEADGSQRRFTVAAESLLNAEPEANLQLQPGDMVVVPPVRTYRVYVTGAVVRPGPVEYTSSEGITALQAVTAAGGPTERARLSSVHVLRRLADGTQTKIKLNLKRIQRGKDPDVPLERNDTVVVGEWAF